MAITNVSRTILHIAAGFTIHLSPLSGAVSIEAVITNLDDRSSFMQFTGSIQGTTNANFTVNCLNSTSTASKALTGGKKVLP